MTAQPGTVLVVDDTPANVRLLEAVLDAHGYRVVCATTGTEALQAVATQSPDLVLLDIYLPDIDGIEVCRRLRADEGHAALPIIMITAAGNEEKLSALEAGADDFVLRPFDQPELLARVRSLLRIRAYHDTIAGQAAELAAWNRTLEEQVSQQVEEVERLGRLRRFLSPHVADMVLSAPDDSMLQPHRREVAVVFCDLGGFTTFAASSEPEEALGALRGFHAIVGDLVAANGATVGYFAGDGLMVFFNDPLPCPDPALRAVTMALQLRDAMADYAATWGRRGFELTIGVGVAFGFATLGTVGFEGRYDYSVIGPVVNLASRLCDEAAPGEVLVSQREYAEVEDQVDAEPRGEVALRGFPGPVRVWAVSGLRTRPVVGPFLGALDLRLLGPLEVWQAGRPVDMRASKERALLALLLVNRGQVVSVERLAEELWDGAPPESAVAALRVHVSRLRKTLAAAGVDNLLVTRPPGYLLDADDGCVDAARFERLTAEGRAALEAGDAETAVEHLRAGLALWRGAALAEFASMPFALAEAARLEECRVAATEDCMDAELAAGRHRQVLGDLEALVVAHPYRERLWAQRMVALYRSGRQPEALQVYQALRRRLDEELGLEPSAELGRLQHAILTQSPDLDRGPAVRR